MAQNDSFQDLVQRLKAGDQQAAGEIFSRYANRLIALARSRLESRLRQKVDPEDVVQSVFRSFFCRHANGQFLLADSGSLWSLLVVMTLHKCGRQVEHFFAARRDVNREQAIASARSSIRTTVHSNEPTPSEAAILSDTVVWLMEPLKPQEREMFSLRLQGYTIAEISAQVGRSERTVERLMNHLRSLVLRLNKSDSTLILKQ